MIAPRLEKYLHDNQVSYQTIQHPIAYTALEIAQRAHVPGKEFLKSVIVKIDGKLAMVIEPSHLSIDFKRLAKGLGVDKVQLASESEFKALFPECELGAMPAFGHLYDMPVYVDDALGDNQEIVFNGGTHTDLIKMRYEDFERLEKPTKVHLH